MKISVIGNCQGAPLRSLLSQYAGAETPDLKVNYLKEEDREAIFKVFSESDWVFAQRVAEDFHLEWMRPSYLRAKFGEKLAVWPTVYFDGYYPDIQYLYFGKNGKIEGPATDYHFGSIIDAYRNGVSIIDAATKFASEEIFQKYPDPIEQSISNLASRELDCDVQISDMIREKYNKSLMQFTPNHPNLEIFIELARRLCDRAGLMHNLDVQSSTGRLDYVYIPPHLAIQDRYNIETESNLFRGVEVRIEDSIVILGSQRTYTIEEMVREYYRVYQNVGL